MPAPQGPATARRTEWRERCASAVSRSTGALSSAAVTRMEAEHAWFADLDAENRSWVGLILQAGVRGFADWLRRGEATAGAPDQGGHGPALAASVFGAAPRTLAGIITLAQTVDLVRLTIEVVESNVDAMVDPADAPDLQVAVSRYAREVAFATAEVYARAAEARGAWDARLEALVVDAVLRAEADETVLSRASAVGWEARGEVAVVLGDVAAGVGDPAAETGLFEEVRRCARTAGLDALCAVQGERLVVLLGGVRDARAAAAAVTPTFGPGPVVVGPVVADLTRAHLSARAALSGYRAATGWPGAPRPVTSVELLPERVLAGDGHARRHLVEDVYRPLAAERDILVTTLAAWFAHAGSTEATARGLFVHPNTVRYRLRQVAEVAGLDPHDPRDALTLQLALVLGRQAD
ncbi:hypothetical protein ENKNEFLB_02676 [Nocardioides aquaticus]|uniref:PucR family transcriptional regulator n=1 Tax=Nocardioides aquaticus TaxID=160826 RepID=A0ABX8EJ37_9ACTN|nr:helix-turn-helix domain-containing protein [Nocardioides aquaticus]QVT80284.1 hypothetical protein ENKNEFLB_02676 [Nocardioides aquaticus]